jgi:hypothetical protein
MFHFFRQLCTFYYGLLFLTYDTRPSAIACRGMTTSRREDREKITLQLHEAPGTALMLSLVPIITMIVTLEDTNGRQMNICSAAPIQFLQEPGKMGNTFNEQV